MNYPQSQNHSYEVRKPGTHEAGCIAQFPRDVEPPTPSRGSPLGELADGGDQVLTRIVNLADTAERIANMLFGAVPKDQPKEAAPNMSGIAHLKQQQQQIWQHVQLSRLTDALDRLERL